MTTLIVVYCPKCNYGLKTAVQNIGGTHGCAECGGLVEVYIDRSAMLAVSWWDQGRDVFKCSRVLGSGSIADSNETNPK